MVLGTTSSECLGESLNSCLGTFRTPRSTKETCSCLYLQDFEDRRGKIVQPKSLTSVGILLILTKLINQSLVSKRGAKPPNVVAGLNFICTGCLKILYIASLENAVLKPCS